ncbi:MAG: electron transfer flavoprotein [Aphanocapsa feldmannii 277cV]|uniref:Electron transfer flavoprotein n=2 Tax=Aphanocapsa feldmannii TaxID=192050 RepID=A0A524RPC4_9CHRO|nr:MAG: electron transfer flavoprotein [Aphanocapsa feldmannii 288cV]TGG93677.1 MAG: electron transfer flavoprotein [Aphanocapsa feldmannii 277cV]TGH21037.1 MAG: electron transfer flavoprotein [Aphanocapsa feldmannii 277cI]
MRHFLIAAALCSSVLACSSELAPPSTAQPAAEQPVSRFLPAESDVAGTVFLDRSGDQTKIIFSDDFKVNRGPDLYVILGNSNMPLLNSEAPYYSIKPNSYTILDRLKSPKGTQSYAVPSELKITDYGSVLIWCRRFNATFAWAPIDLG